MKLSDDDNLHQYTYDFDCNGIAFSVNIDLHVLSNYEKAKLVVDQFVSTFDRMTNLMCEEVRHYSDFKQPKYICQSYSTYGQWDMWPYTGYQPKPEDRYYYYLDLDQFLLWDDAFYEAVAYKYTREQFDNLIQSTLTKMIGHNDICEGMLEEFFTPDGIDRVEDYLKECAEDAEDEL